VAFRRGLVTLNSHHPKDVAGANQRLFDAAASASVQLTEPLVDSLRYFSAEEQMFTFRDMDEMLNKIDFAKSHPALVRAMGTAGVAQVRARHTYEHRLREIADELDALRG
jgi:spore maturation protein CgeB